MLVAAQTLCYGCLRHLFLLYHCPYRFFTSLHRIQHSINTTTIDLRILCHYTLTCANNDIVAMDGGKPLLDLQ
jgi:hypothetical protein